MYHNNSVIPPVDVTNDVLGGNHDGCVGIEWITSEHRPEALESLTQTLRKYGHGIKLRLLVQKFVWGR